MKQSLNGERIGYKDLKVYLAILKLKKSFSPLEHGNKLKYQHVYWIFFGIHETWIFYIIVNVPASI
jgi:hypothetical protein